MRFNFKKISAIASGLLLAGMTMGVAAAANYPSPFVVGSSSDVAIVYGTGTGVSTLDQVEATNIQTDLSGSLTGTGGVATATGGEGFAKVQSFQIISAGQDGDFGYNGGTPPTGGRLFPTGINYDPAPTSADDDNVTNFCDKSNLGDAKP